jgi:hypothetical protein
MMLVRDAFAAESEDDFDLPAVVRRKAPPRPQKRASRQPRKVGVAERVIAQALNNPGKLLAALFLTGCSGAIAWNALALQSVRHPAPLFNHSDPAVAAAAPAAALSEVLPPARPGAESVDAQAMVSDEPVPQAAPPVEAVSAPPVSAPRPPARSAMTDLIRNGGVPPTAPQPAARVQQSAAAPAPTPARAPTVRDPIAEMIRLGGPVPTPPANVGRQDAGDIVLSGQRALARLGYSVKVDGMMGPGTRQAIERFQQDRRIPVTGEFSGRTLRELSSLSGITVQ